MITDSDTILNRIYDRGGNALVFFYSRVFHRERDCTVRLCEASYSTALRVGCRVATHGLSY